MNHVLMLVLALLGLAVLTSGCERPGASTFTGDLQTERTGVVTSQGKPLTLVGPELKVGQRAPEFTVLTNDLAETHLAAYRGKTIIVASVPSLDTPVCDRETRRFNEESSSLGPNVVVLVVSTDLPFAQRRWCGNSGIDRVSTLSDHREVSFGRAWGVLIKETRLLARAVFVVDPSGTIRYVRVLPDLAREPDYDEVLTLVRSLGAVPAS